MRATSARPFWLRGCLLAVLLRDGSAQVLVSSLVYEDGGYALRTLENVLQFTRGDTPVVVHVSAGAKRSDFRDVAAFDGRDGRLRVNPARFATRHGSGTVLLGHVSNALYGASLGLHFRHVLFSSSTSRFFRPGVERHVSRRGYARVEEATWLRKYCESRKRRLHRAFFDALGDKATCRAFGRVRRFFPRPELLRPRRGLLAARGRVLPPDDRRGLRRVGQGGQRQRLGAHRAAPGRRRRPGGGGGEPRRPGARRAAPGRASASPVAPSRVVGLPPVVRPRPRRRELLARVRRVPGLRAPSAAEAAPRPGRRRRAPPRRERVRADVPAQALGRRGRRLPRLPRARRRRERRGRRLPADDAPLRRRGAARPAGGLRGRAAARRPGLDLRRRGPLSEPRGARERDARLAGRGARLV